MAQQGTIPTAERRIFFYRLDAGLDDDGVPVEVDLGPVLARIEGLPFARGGRYVPADGDAVTTCWVDAAGARPRLRIATIRRSGLPQLERTGNLRPLLVGPDEGVAEQSHVVLFRETVDGVPSTIAGAEFNAYGPRVSRLAHYLVRQSAGTLPVITFRPVVRRDAAAALARLDDIRLFLLRVQPAHLAEVSAVSATVGEALRAAAALGVADEYEIVARPRARSRHRIGESFLGLARRLNASEDVRTSASSFQVRGHDRVTGQVESIDLLSDKLIARRPILREDEAGRALNSASAFEAIDEAYDDLRDELLTAASVQILPAGTEGES